MRITPKTEEELSSFDLLPKGTYPFTVLNSDEVASKSKKNAGRMMFAVKLNVHGPQGDKHVYDYFADWFSEWKLRHFAETTGQLKAYEGGELDGKNGAFANRTGYVTLDIEDDPKYGEKNVVKDYVVKKSEAAPAPKAEKVEDDDQSIPF